jgi:hypothetical protein
LAIRIGSIIVASVAMLKRGNSTKRISRLFGAILEFIVGLVIGLFFDLFFGLAVESFASLLILRSATL